MERIILVFSDLEIGEQDPSNSSSVVGFIATVLDKYQHSNSEIDIVFNGDTFDFLKTSYNDAFPHLVSKDIALKKLETIYSENESFFKTLNQFLHTGHIAPRRVHFIGGNHDPELLFSDVKKQIRNYLGGSGQVLIHDFSLRIDNVHIEHSSQQDTLFRIPENQKFVLHNEKEVLNLPWASVLIKNVILPFRDEFKFIDKVKPNEILFQKLPKLKAWILDIIFEYWKTDYIKQYLSSRDPLKKISWQMIKESVARIVLTNTDVNHTNYYQNMIKNSNDIDYCILGHTHHENIWSYHHKKIITTGAVRDEFYFNGEEFKLIPKSYALIRMNDGETLEANLIQEHYSPKVFEPPLSFKEYQKSLDKQIQIRKKITEV